MKDRTPRTAVFWGPVPLLLLILALLSALKVVHAPPVDYYGPDGSTYFQVARHVYEGDGLLTSVSLYHQGLKELPSPTTIYPLWPLVLGLAGRMLGLERAARLLPEVIYLLDLVLLYGLANRLALAWGHGEQRLFQRLPIVLGHIVVLLLGLNLIFFRYSSLPYTDPLALGLTFGALLVLARQSESGSSWLAAASGALAGAAYLARTQMIVVPIAVIATCVFRGRRAAFAAAIGAVVVVLPWLVHLASFVRELHPMMLVDVFTVYRETPEIAAVEWVAPPRSIAEVARHVATGLRVAFWPTGASYVKSFGPVSYVVPLAIVALVCSKRLRACFAASRARSTIAGTALCGVGLAVMAQAAHSESDFARLWSFDHRQGLPFVVLIVSALACTIGSTSGTRLHGPSPWRCGRILRAVAMVLAALSLVGATWQLPALVEPRGRGPTETERALVAWLDAQPVPPVVVARRASRLAAMGRARFHWVGCSDGPDVTRQMFLHANAEYVVARRSDRRCQFLVGLAPELELAASFRGDGPALDLFRWREAPRAAR